MLVTTNERHKRRLVIDYSQTINRFTYLDGYPLPNPEQMIRKIANYNIYTTLDLLSAYHQIPIKDEERHFTAFEADHQLFQFRRIPFGVTNGVACFQRTLDQIISDERLKDVFVYVDNITICGRNQSEHNENLSRFMEVASKYDLTFNHDKSLWSKNSICVLGYLVSNGSIKPDPDRLQPLRDLPLPTDQKSMKRALGLFSYYAQWIPKFSEKIHPLISTSSFPVSSEAVDSFNNIKQDLEKAVIMTVNYNIPFVVETDASEFAIAATLNQNGRPVAFFSRTLSQSEQRHSSIEKEAYAIVESIRKWRHYLLGNHFTLITDQKSVAFMMNPKQSGKTKNEKITRWRIELSSYSYDIIYRPGENNTAADALSRTCFAIPDLGYLRKLHEQLCHPGVTRMVHFVRSRNLAVSVDDVKRVISSCKMCAEVKPRYYKPTGNVLIKATQPFERLNLDFKGPLPSSSTNKYLFVAIDEYSRFPFAYPCSSMTASEIINCLSQLFAIFGTPKYIHSDRGSAFMSEELKTYLTTYGIATSRTTSFNPEGNSQVERYNGVIWKAVLLALRSRNLPVQRWELVLPDALHSLRSLLCTSTNETPHERIFRYMRRSCSGQTLPSWLSHPGKVLMKRQIRNSKYDPLVDEVDLLEANPEYAHVRLPNGKETTVSLKHLAPSPTSFCCSILQQSIQKKEFVRMIDNGASIETRTV